MDSDLKVLLEVLGTKRVEELKNYLLDSIKEDINQSINESYNYIIDPDTFTELGTEVFNEVKAELKKKYKKQLKSVLEAKILKVIDDAEKAINKDEESDEKEQGQKITLNDWSK